MQSLSDTAAEAAQRRLRTWFAPVLDDPGWRGHLVDAQAEKLLAWGLAQVEQTAVRTASLPEEDAAPLLEKDSTAVHLIMAGVDDLMSTVGQPPDFDLIDDAMTRLLKNLRWLTNQPLRPDRLRHIGQFNRARSAEDRGTAFQHLMELIQTE